MNSGILQTATRYLLPILLLFSIVVLLQGHNQPGGGFIGGLIASAAFALHAMSFGPVATRRVLRTDLTAVTGVGLFFAIAAGIVGIVLGDPFLTGEWTSIGVAGMEPVKVGTPVLFDLGVYVVVFGVVMSMVLALLEDETL